MLNSKRKTFLKNKHIFYAFKTVKIFNEQIFFFKLKASVVEIFNFQVKLDKFQLKFTRNLLTKRIKTNTNRRKK